MNKLIKELAKQAGVYISEPNDWGMVDFDTSKVDLEKFALAIVGKCAGIYDCIDNGNDHLGTRDYLEALHKTFRS